MKAKAKDLNFPPWVLAILTKTWWMVYVLWHPLSLLNQKVI